MVVVVEVEVEEEEMMPVEEVVGVAFEEQYISTSLLMKMAWSIKQRRKIQVLQLDFKLVDWIVFVVEGVATGVVMQGLLGGRLITKMMTVIMSHLLMTQAMTRSCKLEMAAWVQSAAGVGKPRLFS